MDDKFAPHTKQFVAQLIMSEFGNQWGIASTLLRIAISYHTTAELVSLSGWPFPLPSTVSTLSITTNLTIDLSGRLSAVDCLYVEPHTAKQSARNVQHRIGQGLSPTAPEGRVVDENGRDRVWAFLLNLTLRCGDLTANVRTRDTFI